MVIDGCAPRDLYLPPIGLLFTNNMEKKKGETEVEKDANFHNFFSPLNAVEGFYRRTETFSKIYTKF